MSPYIPFLAGAIFLIGYLGITLEHKTKVSKSAIALVVGCLLWIIVALINPGQFEHQLIESGAEIFGIVVFLLAAMALVEILVHYRFFDFLRGQLFKLHLNERSQMIVIAFITFFLSAIIDNLTTTIVMIQISRKFFKGENLLRAAALIVVAANAGGAFSPIGDVTTIMLWLGNKFSTDAIILKGFLPSFALFLTSLVLIVRKVIPSEFDATDEVITKLGRSEWMVIAMIFVSFSFPLLAGLVHLPAYVGLLLGFGIVWMITDVFKIIRPKATHLSASIDELIKKVDIASLKFFIGILLAVSALHALGILEVVSSHLFGETENFTRMIFGNIGLGLLSPIVDNVPLTAMAMDILKTTNESIWVLLALMVGTGGSMLAIGSAAGVVAMGMVKELHFGKYLSIATFPAFAGFVVCIGVWCVQYFILGF